MYDRARTAVTTEQQHRHLHRGQYRHEERSRRLRQLHDPSVQGHSPLAVELEQGLVTTHASANEELADLAELVEIEHNRPQAESDSLLAYELQTSPTITKARAGFEEEDDEDDETDRPATGSSEMTVLEELQLREANDHVDREPSQSKEADRGADFPLDPTSLLNT